MLEWELNRKQEATDILKTGKRVYKTDLERHEKAGTPLDFAVTCVGLFVQLWARTDFRMQARTVNIIFLKGSLEQNLEHM